MREVKLIKKLASMRKNWSLKEVDKMYNRYRRVSFGRCAKIGANAVITKDVPEKAVMVGIPAKNVGLADSEFKPYGITPDSDTKSE